ncbi:hypothetical protein B0T22DRAFT_441381 [Podospora appendiculata]|uniref:Protein kinase domain-containing protein n=1 Tax=Podospora appendiculata TaxID=314037 RepID=A0AAE1CDP5_9PEZI|nr:hypothetical protein B0T22DRAFT_441381 [Podospora appendiculata]
MSKYAFLFKTNDTADKKYLLVRNSFASGVQSTVQLVRDVETGEVVIRKVTACRIKTNNGKLPQPDREIEILKLLKSFPTTNYPAPRLAECISNADIQSAPGKYSRVSYWKFYNGGTVQKAFYQEHKYLPYSLLARFMWQICESLQFMYQAGPEAVYHTDLHTQNIWLHWPENGSGDLPDFIIGDFGDCLTASEYQACIRNQQRFMSVTGTVTPAAGRRKVEYNTYGRLGASFHAEPGERELSDICFFLPDLQCAAMLTHRNWRELYDQRRQRKMSGKLNDEPFTRFTLLENIIDKLRDLWVDDINLAAQDGNSLPVDFSEVIQMAKDLETQCLTDGPLDERQTPTFLSYRKKSQESLQKQRSEYAKTAMVRAATIKQALEPHNTQNLDGIAMGPILGPWYLVKIVSTDNQAEIEYKVVDDKPHHRPTEYYDTSDSDDMF